jgi:hypothetical protein
MFIPLPKDSGENLVVLPLKGVLGLPNSWAGCCTFPSVEEGTGEDAISTCAFFDGVSGIAVFPYTDADGRSMLRFRFEIKPVDMKACGSGRANL